MEKLARFTLVTAASLLASSLLPLPALACHKGGDDTKGCDVGGGGGGEVAANWYTWMHADVADAFNAGNIGTGARITVVDSYASDAFAGRLKTTSSGGWEDIRYQTHGGWTSEITGLVAPGATIIQDEWDNGPVKFQRGFNVANLSYVLLGTRELNQQQIDGVIFSRRDQSLIDAAEAGTAVVVKAAGNDPNVGVGEYNQAAGTQDWLNLALIDAQSAIFVGALDWNGDVADQSLAWYSTKAGSLAQSQYLVVGVEAGKDAKNYSLGCGAENGTCLYGTSFAAPVVAGYAAIVGAKFGASPTAVANRLLDTARTDTLIGYDPLLHGQGEASLSLALAPLGVK